MKPLNFSTQLMVLTSPLLAAEKGSEWIDLMARIDPEKHSIVGTWEKSKQGLTVNQVRSGRLEIPYRPTGEYDFRARFTRTSGVHSVALMFVAGKGQATFEVDAWAEHLAGIQMIDGSSIKQNASRTTDQTLINNRAYTMMVQVRRNEVRIYLDDKLLSTVKTDGSDLSMLDLWKLRSDGTLGIGAYDSATTFHSIEVRPINGGNVAKVPTPTPTPKPTPTPARPSTKKKVLIVIANQDFFYREYGDPRRELERAGFQVVVGAGRRGVCRPHPSSGQNGEGAVRAEIALSEVKADDYEAIMFSGGWGSSMYQYAFTGTYSNRVYNGNRQIKIAANRVINDFLKQKKYVGALCHGVSVLAWARVNNRSPLAGKRVCAPQRSGPAGVYFGRQSQPPSRWNAQVNGARLLPAGSIGNRSTPADDVTVDGNIITGEDDRSSRHFGQTLARLLQSKK